MAQLNDTTVHGSLEVTEDVVLDKNITVEGNASCYTLYPTWISMTSQSAHNDYNITLNNTSNNTSVRLATDGNITATGDVTAKRFNGTTLLNGGLGIIKYEDSAWAGGSGDATPDNGTIVWREKFSYADTSTQRSDSGDMVLFLRNQAGNTTGVELCVNIDGDFYSMGDKIAVNNREANFTTLTTTGLITAGTSLGSNDVCIKTSGRIQANSFNAVSDARLKENFNPLNIKKSILDLPTYKFNFIGDKTPQIGCKAQDLKEICPEIVSEGQDGYLSIQESKIVYLLLDEVKKLRKELDELRGN